MTSREADVLEAPPELGAGYVCNAPLDRTRWAVAKPIAALVMVRDDGVEICLGALYPIEDFAQ